MRMRPLIPCLLAPALMAQAPADPAEARMAQVKADADPASPQFLWLRPKGQFFQGSWELDLDYSAVAAAREISYADFNEGEAEAWARRLGWESGGHWLLMSPEGDPLLSGTVPPEASALLDAMRSTGWTPRYERLTQFLREHPDNGDAWVESLLNAGAMARRQANIGRRLSGAKPLSLEERLNPPPLDAATDQARWNPTVEALNGLMGVDGWTRHRKLMEILVQLAVDSAKGSALLKDPFQHMRRGVEDALQRDPSSGDLWILWSFLTDLAPGGNAEDLVDGLDAPPRSPWPPTAAASPIGEALYKAGRWGELKAIASRAYARGMDPALLPFIGEQSRLALVRAWGFWRVLALVKLDRREEASSVLKEMSAQYGSQWPEHASGPLADSLAFYLGETDPLIATLKAAKAAKAPPDPPKPGFPSPLRLALAGHPNWEKEWNRYPSLSVFDSWEPDEELGWKPLAPMEEKALRARMSWGAEPHWALMRGSECLASGAALPKASFLADRLRAEGTPYLVQLEAFIRTHPDRLDAREARMTELRGRMPNERLEAEMLDDARATKESFWGWEGPAAPADMDWKPRKELWAATARKVLPELEARIRNWPERLAFWEAWFDWSALLDQPPSPARFLASLDIWKTRFEGGAGPLPDEVMIFGAMYLEKAGRWDDLLAWCQAFWEGGVRERVRSLSAPSGNRSDLMGRRMFRQIYEGGLISRFKEALEKLGRAAQLRAFLQELNDMDPSMAKALTASSTPPRPEK